jgi:Ca-activated chloride channel family protein
VEELIGFPQGHDRLEGSLVTLSTPPFSELNFYDALVATLSKMQGMQGRKALLVVSSGLDTFSKANYQDALRAVHQSDVPIYVINLGHALQDHISMSPRTGPYVIPDWKRAESELQAIATESGGRVYSPQNTYDLSGMYDDLMENLRVRYVITYKSTGGGDLNAPRTVRVELVNPTTSDPLEIIDANGKPIRSKVFIEDSYVPATAAMANKKTGDSKAKQE